MKKSTVVLAVILTAGLSAGCTAADPGKADRLAREAPVPVEVTTTTAGPAEAPVETVEPVETTTTTQAPAPKPVKRAGVTKAQYDQLATDMSYAQVSQILGSGGEELSSSEIGAGTEYHTVSVMYQWEGAADYSNMNAMFQDDKLVTKAQFGLE